MTESMRPSHNTRHKRRRVDPTSDSAHSDDSSDVNDEIQRQADIMRPSANDFTQHATFQGSEVGHIIVHQVKCVGGIGHEGHERSTCFLDEPHLFQGDDKTQPLRGRRYIDDVPMLREDNPEISFVVERNYGCVAHHESSEVLSLFERLVAPSSQIQVTTQTSARARPPAQIRLYLSVLIADTKPPRPISEQIILCSPQFVQALKAAQRLLPKEFDLMREWEEAESLIAPYLQCFHARSYLMNYRKRLDDMETQQIDVLLGYIQEQFGPEYAAADNLFGRGKFTLAHAHKLFGPGDIVTMTQNGHDVAFTIEECPNPRLMPITLNCFTWSFDGAFHKEPTQIEVLIDSTASQPDEEIPISSLNAKPLVFDQSGLDERLQKRGEFFWKLRNGHLVTSRAPQRGFDIQLTNPRYMVDMETYNALHGDGPDADNQAETLPRHGDLSTDELRSDTPPQGNFTLMLPPTIKAFRFHDKKWKTLAVEHLREITWDKAAFEKLVLSKEKKRLIQGLVKNHVVNSASADLIEGKGNGLVVLLHGPPGTGKTLTAESVAEFSQRPLYRLTSGDVGTDPEVVEKSLEHIFYLGTTWKAVVLLDECEVFMEERVPADLRRNALVSVFLRALEYYDGILILTSNRVGTFDEAFKSRMHLAMYYPPLREEDRRDIWVNLFSNLAKEIDRDVKVRIDLDDLTRNIRLFAQEELNGRQIRNAIHTARQLALAEAEVFASSHIRDTIKVVREFEDYVKDTQGGLSSAHRMELAAVRRKDPDI